MAIIYHEHRDTLDLKDAFSINADLFVEMLTDALDFNKQASEDDFFNICIECITSGVYKQLIDSTPLRNDILSAKNIEGEAAIVSAIKKYPRARSFFTALFKELDVEALKDSDRNGLTIIAATLGHAVCIEKLIEGAIKASTFDRRDDVLEKMLLAEFPGQGPAYAIRLAAQNGHAACIEKLIEGATKVSASDKRDDVLEKMLLAEFPGQSLAHAIRTAAQNGHAVCIEKLIEGAIKASTSDRRDALLEQMLLAELSGRGPAHAIRVAAQNGHAACIEKLIEGAIKASTSDRRDALLEQMLLAGSFEQDLAYAIRTAAQNGHAACVEKLIEGAIKASTSDIGLWINL
ncbi:hypothetical protein [Candidiatus Paracoxiella cheracis]|uniref:hypothetical protein n=1 Tax=Candidiatus Paracoxiella cheracis TaxID=3405120 RepID=UPI003BF4EFB2